MNSNQKIFLAINIVGGILVLASYVIGLKAGKSADVLWGGTPKNIRGVYTVSMLVSATGFFLFTIFTFLQFKNVESILPYSLDKNVFHILYSVLLICSMLWIPLVNLMVSTPSTLLWISIRTVLILVGLSSLILLILLLKISPKPTGFLYISSIIGLSWFFIHTGILDALLWPYYWK